MSSHLSKPNDRSAGNMGFLRSAGDFPNRGVVEYATVLVKIPNGRLPSNIRDYHWRMDADSVVTLSVSPNGRLTNKELILESVELAEQLVMTLHEMFQNREYRDCYQLDVAVRTSTATKMTTKRKIKHSHEVNEFLSNKSVITKPKPTTRQAANLAVKLYMEIGGECNTYYVKHLTKKNELSLAPELHFAKLYSSPTHCASIKDKLLSLTNVSQVEILCLSPSELDAIKDAKDEYMRLARGIF